MSTPSPTKTSVSTSLAPGELLLGRYQVLRHVASGGMGQVFEVLDLELEQRIALKTLHPRIADNTEALERFKREIRLARRVTHPNVCRLFDFGCYRTVRGEEEREVLFLTMELLEGESLASYVTRRGRLPLPEVATIVEQVARGLEAAHEQGIIHRDLNSRNVHLVMASGGLRAVITDFGLARQITSTSGSTLTLGGDLLGTPAYMAPEQLEGGEVSPATDLYAFGVVIYEMLTGRLPFEGDTPISVAMQHLRNPPPGLRELVPDLDPRWEAIALRCLEKHPSRRFASAAQLREAVLGKGVKASDIHRPARTWPRAAVGGALLVVLAPVLWLLLDRAATPVPATPSTASAEAPKPADPPASAPANAEAAQRYAEGLDHLHTFRYQAARAAFEQAIAADPRFPMAQAWLVQAQMGLGNRKGAREAARKALTLAGQLSREDQLLIKTLYHAIHGDDAAALVTGRELVTLVPGSTDYALMLAELLLQQGKPEEVEALLETLRQRPPPQGEDPRIDVYEAWAAFRRSDFGRMRQAAERAVAKAETHGLAAIEACARLQLSDALMHVEGMPASTEQAARARELFVEAGERSGEAKALLTEGFVLNGQGQTQRAEELFRRALEIHRSFDNVDGIATSLDRLANVAWMTGDLETARARYLEAIEIYRQTENKAGLMRTTYNLGLLQMSLRELEAARVNFEAALAFWREGGSRGGEATALNGLGILALWSGNLAEATLRFSEAAAIHESLGDLAGTIVPLSNLARSSLRLGDLAQATEQLERARRLMEQTGDNRARRNVLGGLVQLYQIQDRLDDAERMLTLLGPPALVASAADEELESWVLPTAVLIARGRYEQAAESARKIVAAARAAGATELETWGRLKLVAALLGLGRLQDAETELLALGEQPASGPNPELELERRLAQARLQAATGDTEAARQTLKELRQLTEKESFYEFELEARHALCELGVDTATTNTCLAELESEAAQKGFRRLARQSAERRARLKAT